MARKRYSSEEIIRLSRQGDVMIGQGKGVGQMCREFGITNVT